MDSSAFHKNHAAFAGDSTAFHENHAKRTLHRAPVGQGPPGPGWLAISLGFWSGRALATGTAWAGLCLIHHHHHHHENHAKSAVNSSAYGEIPPAFGVNFSTSRENQAALRYVQISRALFTSHSVKFGRPFFAFLRFFCLSIPLCPEPARGRRWSARRAVVGSASQLNPEAHHKAAQAAVGP